MKKTAKTLSLLFVALAAFAFAPSTIKKIDVKESSIAWVGKKVTGQHTGTINLKEGYLEMDGDAVKSGKFVVDMTSLTVTDLEAGKGKEKLEGHLNSDDFFGVANHPTATLNIKKGKVSGNTHTLMGDITIKGETQPLTFDLVMNGNTGTAKVVIDRTKFGIRYGSGSFFDNLGDKAIYDDFELDITLKF
ncbi:YceI family protein [Aureitalea marina]|uniref:Lipid-binding protein n=1 Tax=Aureitalea marina TaxID=930804 RepID=A0A2S7KQG2_9FLAO|nr:YceI family protein [Aureitalea marina]PQB04864.1 lipid-binding protein [Aureitalea marina]